MKWLESIKDIFAPAPSKLEKQRQSMRAHQVSNSVRLEARRAARCARGECVSIHLEDAAQ